jgi:hypothetical protein
MRSGRLRASRLLRMTSSSIPPASGTKLWFDESVRLLDGLLDRNGSDGFRCILDGGLETRALSIPGRKPSGRHLRTDLLGCRLELHMMTQRLIMYWPEG